MDGVYQDGEIGRVYLAVDRRARQVLGQEAAGCIDRLLHVARSGIDVRSRLNYSS